MLVLWTPVLQLSCLIGAISNVQDVSQEGNRMEPPRERFERSISEQEERTKELLDNFKTEMMERFQKQEERIGRQEEKNAEQDLKISFQVLSVLGVYLYIR